MHCGKDCFRSEVGECGPTCGRAAGRLENLAEGGKDRTGANGIGGTEECDEWHAEGISKVHAAGIIGHEKAAFAKFLDVGNQVGVPSEIVDADGVESARDGRGDGSIVSGTK